jgi:hypothetical protein
MEVELLNEPAQHNMMENARSKPANEAGAGRMVPITS